MLVIDEPSCNCCHDSLIRCAAFASVKFFGKKLNDSYISFVSLNAVSTVHIAGVTEITTVIESKVKNIQYMVFPLAVLSSAVLNIPVCF